MLIHWASLAISSVAIVVTFILRMRQKGDRELWYELVESSFIEDSRFHRAVSLFVWSTGRETIPSDAFVRQMPIRFSLLGPPLIDIAWTPVGSQAPHIAKDARDVTIGPGDLRRDFLLAAAIRVEGFDPCSVVVKDLPAGTQIYDAAVGDPARDRLWWAAAGACVLVASTLGGVLAYLIYGGDVTSVLTVVYPLMAIGAITLIVALMGRTSNAMRRLERGLRLFRHRGTVQAGGLPLR